jgi:hypothetical protein
MQVTKVAVSRTGPLEFDLRSEKSSPMVYADFDLGTALRMFGLSVSEDCALFAKVMPIRPSSFLQIWFDETLSAARRVNSAKARSELIIAPMLAEAQRRSGTKVRLLPGVSFVVDPTRGLTGDCDYLLAESKEAYLIRAPVLAVVEARAEDLAMQFGRCAAAMVAIQVFNEREGRPLPAAHGCVTSGIQWQFLRIQGKTLFIDRAKYSLSDVEKILGILITIARG